MKHKRIEAASFEAGDCGSEFPIRPFCEIRTEIFLSSRTKRARLSLDRKMGMMDG